jgi:hypothetical protein
LTGLSSDFEQLSFTIICSIVQREETRKKTMSIKGTAFNQVQENSSFNSYKSDGNKNWNKEKEKKMLHWELDGHTKRPLLGTSP